LYARSLGDALQLLTVTAAAAALSAVRASMSRS
jgi:hypothetical protein